MGYYINHDSKGNDLSSSEKCYDLIEDGAKEISGPLQFQENLVCVVDNRMFEAAAYCYNEDEFNEFNRNDGRRKRWFVYEHAKKLSGFE